MADTPLTISILNATNRKIAIKIWWKISIWLYEMEIKKFIKKFSGTNSLNGMNIR